MQFSHLWSRFLLPKISCFLWLILHKALWTCSKALKIGTGNGLCPRCGIDEGTLPHLFIQCKQALDFFKCVFFLVNPPLWIGKSSSLGESYGFSTIVWNVIRANYLGIIWKDMNSILFGNGITDTVYSLTLDLFFQIKSLLRQPVRWRHLLQIMFLWRKRISYLSYLTN